MNVYDTMESRNFVRKLIEPASVEVSFLKGENITNAYLYGELDGPIIMEQPKDSLQITAKSVRFCKLHNSLYRTTQVGKIWGSPLDNQVVK